MSASQSRMWHARDAHASDSRGALVRHEWRKDGTAKRDGSHTLRIRPDVAPACQADLDAWWGALTAAHIGKVYVDPRGTLWVTTHADSPRVAVARVDAVLRVIGLRAAVTPMI